MKKNLKIAKEKIAKSTNKGITLIALVVTIVVLLILAAITITAIMSEGGIFSTAKRAQSLQDEAAIREKLQIMLADAQLEKLVNNTALKTYLTGKGYTVTEDAIAGTVTITEDGYNVTIDEDTLEITGMTKADGSESEGGTNPPSNPTISVTGVSLDKEVETMTVGGSLTLTAAVAPETASNKAVTWTSSVPAVATVTNGVVNALTAGTTTITVTTTDGSYTDTCDITVNATGTSTVADLIGKPAASTNTYTEDKYGNKIVIPAGFKVLGNGGDTYVVYDYDKNEQGTSTGIPVVQDGIVIQHETDLNEFVWVPVGEIKNDAKGENITEIKLGRYNNYLNGFEMNKNTTPPTPPDPCQEASKTEYDTDIVLINLGEGYYGYDMFENTTGEYEGTKYLGERFETLGNWISNTIDNRGYYIARYEASYGENGEADSKQSIGTPLNHLALVATKKTEGQLFNWATQKEASDASEAMYPYSSEANYYSELMNSYAWDTAIIFIQTYENPDYANQASTYYNSEYPFQPANTGERGATASIGPETTDKVCNIYDMASNCNEWTTESCANGNSSVVTRGGIFLDNEETGAGSRGSSFYADEGTFVSFRTVLNCDINN